MNPGHLPSVSPDGSKVLIFESGFFKVIDAKKLAFLDVYLTFYEDAI